MKIYEIVIYSTDGSVDENGDINCIKHEFNHTTFGMLDMLDHVKDFILDSGIAKHKLCIEIDQL